jgi:hypothetical protein
VTWRKGHGRDNVAPRNLKGRTDEKRPWKGRECKNGIRNQGSRQELRLGSDRISNRIYRKTSGLEVVK